MKTTTRADARAAATARKLGELLALLRRAHETAEELRCEPEADFLRLFEGRAKWLADQVEDAPEDRAHWLREDLDGTAYILSLAVSNVVGVLPGCAADAANLVRVELSLAEAKEAV